MTTTITSYLQKTKLYEEKLLEIYSKKQSIMQVLKAAVAQEEHFRKGAHLNSSTVLIKAENSDETGLWTVTIEVDHGKVVYTCMDEDANHINIFSIPNAKYIKDKENLSEGEIKAIQIHASNSIDLNLKDVKTLRMAKEHFKDDYVLKHVPLYHLDSDNAARFIIWHIKAYKKVFKDYINTFEFLWEGTSFKNARSLAKEMVARDLVAADYFKVEEQKELTESLG
ncbi:MAG: hypothetical protein O3C63_00150 [Cyanobacteria bacterium]|nr:hypothetical protein [Cyanobacteriota bacterium]MDA1020532.1 hypothetical protein [Cyanobacteriota bacterium]